MNLLENYIVKIYDVSQRRNAIGTYILVDMDVNCYGDIKRIKEIFINQEEWNKVKDQGYYLA